MFETMQPKTSGMKGKASAQGKGLRLPAGFRASRPVAQRLIYEQEKKTLFVNENWKNKEYVNPATHARTKILAGNRILPAYEQYIKESYGINEQNISFKFYINTVMMRQLKNHNARDLKQIYGKSGRKEYIKSLKVQLNNKRRDNHNLYHCYSLNEFVTGTVAPQPVLQPEDLCDPEGISDVDKDWEDALKAFSCVLIAMIKQTEQSAEGADNFHKTADFKEKMKTLIADEAHNRAIEEKAAAYFVKNGINNSTELYELVGMLHNVLHGQNELKTYDLDRTGERLYKQKGYRLILSCSSSFQDLGKNIPAGLTLEMGKAYIFGIEGHAMAVKMLKDLTFHPDAQINPDLYFTSYNDPQNYNVEWKTKLVNQIWSK